MKYFKDIESIKATFNNNENNYNKIISLLIIQLEEIIKTEFRDIKALEFSMHKLKSSVAFLKCKLLLKQISIIENRKSIDELESLVIDYKEIIRLFLNEIK